MATNTENATDPAETPPPGNKPAGGGTALFAEEGRISTIAPSA